jgi:hypothetical protein
VEGEFALIKDNMSRCDDPPGGKIKATIVAMVWGDSLGKCMLSGTEFVGGNCGLIWETKTAKDLKMIIVGWGTKQKLK